MKQVNGAAVSMQRGAFIEPLFASQQLERRRPGTGDNRRQSAVREGNTPREAASVFWEQQAAVLWHLEKEDRETEGQKPV